jgi:hypothetical protein
MRVSKVMEFSLKKCGDFDFIALKVSETMIATLFGLGVGPRMSPTIFEVFCAAMNQRVEVNLFFEQGLYLMLFASNAGGV